MSGDVYADKKRIRKISENVSAVQLLDVANRDLNLTRPMLRVSPSIWTNGDPRGLLEFEIQPMDFMKRHDGDVTVAVN